eukprot:9402579-Ditylum_brightwellii.AAC.1
MEQDSEFWASLLRFMGGLLELQKCLYHVIHFIFQENGAPQMQLTKQNTPLRICQATNNDWVEVEFKLVYNPHKILGHYKSPAGTGKVQKDVIKTKAEQYAVKSIGYVLGQTFLSKKDLEDIDYHAIQAFISNCGYNRNMAYAMHNGPSHL